jgi:hypothetical protein
VELLLKVDRINDELRHLSLKKSYALLCDKQTELSLQQLSDPLLNLHFEQIQNFAASTADLCFFVLMLSVIASSSMTDPRRILFSVWNFFERIRTNAEFFFNYHSMMFLFDVIAEKRNLKKN